MLIDPISVKFNTNARFLNVAKNNPENLQQKRNYAPNFSYPANYYSNNISFGYSFELRNPKGIPCAYCGNETLSKNGIYEMCDLSGQDLKNYIHKYYSKMPEAFTEPNKEAIRIFEQVALDKPEKNGSELLPIAFTRSRSKMLIKQMKVYSKIENLAKKLNSDELKEYIEELKNQDVYLRRDITVEELSEFLKNNNNVQYRKDVIEKIREIKDKDENDANEENWAKVIEIIDHLPSSKNDPDAYLVKFISKALRKDSKIESELFTLSDTETALFYSKLLFPCLSSAEHVQPFSKQGASHFSNYLLTHAFCNTKRGNEDWTTFLLKNPEIFDNVLLNLETILTDEKLGKTLRKMDARKYVKDITIQIHNQLSPARRSAEIDKYLKKLDEFRLNYIPYHACNCNNIFEIPELNKVADMDKNLRAHIFGKLETIIENCPQEDLQNSLDRLLNGTLVDLKLKHAKDFYYFKQSLDKDPNVPPELHEYINVLISKDPIMNLDPNKIKNVKKIFSPEFAQKYQTGIDKKLQKIYPEGIKNNPKKRTIERIPKKLSPLAEKGLLVFVLMNAKDEIDGTYDIDFLKSFTKTLKTL